MLVFMCDIKKTFSHKYRYGHYLPLATLGSYVACVGAVLCRLPYRDIFGGIGNLILCIIDLKTNTLIRHPKSLTNISQAKNKYLLKVANKR